MTNIETLFSQNTATATAAPIPKKNELGQDEFLKLMLAQLKNQDPMQPLENGEFVAQMAQFSTVSGIESMNDSMQKLNDNIMGNQLVEASSLIGRSALLENSSSLLGKEGEITGYYRLPQSIASSTLSITNESGEVVYQSTRGYQGEGLHKYTWNGELTNGNRAAPGTYTTTLLYGSESAPTTADILSQREIISIAIAPDSNRLTFETDTGTTIELKDIQKLL